MFKAIAYAEQVHAKNHVKNLDIMKNTKENLQSAINGVTFEIEEMYLAYDAIAKLQGEKGAEKIHAKLYKEAKEAVEKGKDIEIKEIYICPVCGYTHIEEPPEKCPICGAPKEKFKKF